MRAIVETTAPSEMLLRSKLYFERILGLFQKYHGVQFEVVPSKKLEMALQIKMISPHFPGRVSTMEVSRAMYLYLTADHRSSCEKLIQCLFEMEKSLNPQK